MKRNEHLDSAVELLAELRVDLHAAAIKARQVLAWTADEADAITGPMLKNLAEFAVEVSQQEEVAINLHGRVRRHADFAAVETPEEMDEFAANLDGYESAPDLPGGL